MVEGSPDLARVLGDVAFELQQQSGREATLRAIVDSAVSVVPGARWAGISMIQGRRVSAEVPTDPLVAELDGLQTSLDEGPCLTALREHHTVHVQDMATETRWPRFTRAALERGVGSLLAFQLFVQQENLGALNLYGGQSGAFGEDSVFIGQVLAQHASIAMTGEAAATQFSTALASRDVIGQAKGLLMHQRNLDSVQAFALLLKTSQNANLKLVDIARWVVEQHNAGLDPPP